MQLLFLGTSASEGYPNSFCACDNCETARKLGGPSLRKRSTALIDRELLLDLGRDLMAASIQHQVSLAGVRYCLQTHEHHDHLAPSHFGSRSPFCGVHDAPRLHYYASRHALKLAGQALRRDDYDAWLLDAHLSDKLNLTAYHVETFQHFGVGPYSVFSLQANHALETTAMLYLVRRHNKTNFYGTDTGDLPAASWDALARLGWPIDLLILDHTFGYKGRSSGHMNSDQFVEHVARLRDMELLAPGARIFATHIGHHSNPAHPDLVQYAATRGYEVAYDGLCVEV